MAPYAKIVLVGASTDTSSVLYYDVQYAVTNRLVDHINELGPS
ncbi:hypothetical protein PQ610_03080 [Tardisphaera miroshnichenkoae]